MNVRALLLILEISVVIQRIRRMAILVESTTLEAATLCPGHLIDAQFIVIFSDSRAQSYALIT